MREIYIYINNQIYIYIYIGQYARSWQKMRPKPRPARIACISVLAFLCVPLVCLLWISSVAGFWRVWGETALVDLFYSGFLVLQRVCQEPMDGAAAKKDSQYNQTIARTVILWTLICRMKPELLLRSQRPEVLGKRIVMMKLCVYAGRHRSPGPSAEARHGMSLLWPLILGCHVHPFTMP